MILDLPRFVATEQPYWEELERRLQRLEDDPHTRLSLADAQRFHYLYQRALAGLAKINTFAAVPETRHHLEALIARTYAELHETRGTATRLKLWHWFSGTMPRTFRRHLRAFALAAALTLAGTLCGGLFVATDPAAKRTLMPFGGLQITPQERVKQEESRHGDHLTGRKGSFSAELMTHNTQVAIVAFGFGITWGVGTSILLFYNGVILGAVGWDYLAAGQAKFLFGWLLPHGVVEIPAILVGGQAGLVLAAALVGWGERTTRRQRLRLVAPDLLTLIGGAACLLVWAGLVEAFLSQYHEPVLPYSLKIAIGLAELCVLVLFLARAGRQHE